MLVVQTCRLCYSLTCCLLTCCLLAAHRCVTYLQAVSAELSQLEATVLVGLQQSAADAERQLMEVKHQLDSLAPEEGKVLCSNGERVVAGWLD